MQWFFSPETELFLEILIFSSPNLFHWKFICMVKVNMHVDSNFFNCAWIFLVKHGSKLQNSYIFFKFHPFLQKILLNYSVCWHFFMSECTQTWIFPNFHYLYDSSHSHFLICNEYAMIFSPETEIFLRNSYFFHRQTCFIGIFFLCGLGQYACRL